eukprot:TRINITY_DN2724_c1_g1_i1.p1 TRINITY_DN2724_c1_g1~~TRINITY_DN2724_c1_g1_i1.p1  ORF type:complete len:705 (+),score=163.29 TRINITY_DN2724_c1_g1_i1:150-2264(+)
MAASVMMGRLGVSSGTGRPRRWPAWSLLQLLLLLLLLVVVVASGSNPVHAKKQHRLDVGREVETSQGHDEERERLFKRWLEEYEGDQKASKAENSEALSSDDPQFYVYLGLSLFCIVMAGLMSGLTMGLMSMDTMNLEIMVNSGTPTVAKNALRILPLVKRHHLLLVTLLISNAAAMEMLPLFLDRLVGAVVAIVLSVTCVLFFGEIIPQAVCTRYGLAVGAYLHWFVWGLIIILFPIAYPISFVLDLILGKGGHGSFYRRAELKELVGFHADLGTSEDFLGSEKDLPRKKKSAPRGHPDEGGLTRDEVTIIKGALDMRTKTVATIMTPIDKVVMLNFDSVLDASLIQKMVAAGHSRFPIFRKRRNNILGVLLIKNLVGIDLSVRTPISDLEHIRPLPVVSSTMPLYDMLHLFSEGKSHMALCVDPRDHVTPLGVLTLEDVLEELINFEIVDETDVYEDVALQIRVSKTGSSDHITIDLNDDLCNDPEYHPQRSLRNTSSHHDLPTGKEMERRMLATSVGHNNNNNNKNATFADDDVDVLAHDHNQDHDHDHDHDHNHDHDHDGDDDDGHMIDDECDTAALVGYKPSLSSSDTGGAFGPRSSPLSTSDNAAAAWIVAGQAPIAMLEKGVRRGSMSTRRSVDEAAFMRRSVGEREHPSRHERSPRRSMDERIPRRAHDDHMRPRRSHDLIRVVSPYQDHGQAGDS